MSYVNNTPVFVALAVRVAVQISNIDLLPGKRSAGRMQLRGLYMSPREPILTTSTTFDASGRTSIRSSPTRSLHSDNHEGGGNRTLRGLKLACPGRGKRESDHEAGVLRNLFLARGKLDSPSPIRPHRTAVLSHQEILCCPKHNLS